MTVVVMLDFLFHHLSAVRRAADAIRRFKGILRKLLDETVILEVYFSLCYCDLVILIFCLC